MELLDQQGHDDRVEMIKSSDGSANLRIRGKKGKSIFLYDMNDPLEESRKIFEKTDFTSDRVTFMLSLGLGYNAKAILEKIEPGHKVVVLEKNATILRMGLSMCDLSRPIMDNAIVFSLTDRKSIKTCAARYAARKVQEDIIYATNHKLKEIDPDYKEIEENLVESINSVLVGALTGLRNAQKFVDNDLRNFPKFLFSSGVNKLNKRFEKMPAIIVSAGPSLEKNIHLLKEAKGRAVLFATGPVVRIMLAHDIMPDFVVSIDFLEQNYRHFEGVCHLNVPLIRPCSLYHGIVRDYQGHGFVYQDGSGITGWLKGYWPFRGLSNAGGSVALHAFVTAIVSGCDPIIFIGQDLSFSNKTHTEGAALAKKVDTSEKNQTLIWVDGIDGGKVPSNSAFVSYLRRFEEIIGSIDNKCINSTEGGAAIRGAEVMPLNESIDKYCTNELPVGPIIRESCVLDTIDYTGMIREMEGKIKQMGRIQSLISRGLKTNKEISRRVRKGRINDPKTEEIIEKNYRTSTEVQKFCEKFSITASFLKKEVHEINRSQYRYESVESDRKGELQIGLKRNRFILKAACNVVTDIKSRLKKIVKVIKGIEEFNALVESNENGFHVCRNRGRLFADLGLHRLAVREYIKSLDLKGTPDSYLGLAESRLALEDIKAARKSLRKYLKLGGNPEKEEKLKGEINKKLRGWRDLARDYYQKGRWINALLYARKLESAGSHKGTCEEIISGCLEMRNQKIREAEEKKDVFIKKKEEEKAFKDLISKGKKSMGRRDMEEAIKLFQKAVNECPEGQDTIEAKSLLACCFSEKNQIEKAEEIFKGLMEKYPEVGVFNLNLGRAYLRNGMPEQALSEYEEALLKERRYYFLCFEIGTLHMKKGRHDKAIEYFEKYLQYSPDSYELIAKTGTCYLAQGMPDKARERYQEALEMQPEYEAAKIGLDKIEEMEQRHAFMNNAAGK